MAWVEVKAGVLTMGLLSRGRVAISALTYSVRLPGLG